MLNKCASVESQIETGGERLVTEKFHVQSFKLVTNDRNFKR